MNHTCLEETIKHLQGLWACASFDYSLCRLVLTFVRRLATLQLLIHATLGYLIHPSVSLPDSKGELCIADVGTGTGQITLVFTKLSRVSLSLL